MNSFGHRNPEILYIKLGVSRTRPVSHCFSRNSICEYLNIATGYMSALGRKLTFKIHSAIYLFNVSKVPGGDITLTKCERRE